jgi:hypothetical protein
VQPHEGGQEQRPGERVGRLQPRQGEYGRAGGPRTADRHACLEETGAQALGHVVVEGLIVVAEHHGGMRHRPVVRPQLAQKNVDRSSAPAHVEQPQPPMQHA